MERAKGEAMKSPSMTRAHFKLIAEVIARVKPYADPEGDMVFASDIVSDFADALTSTNPSFNRERFIEACQPRKGKS